MNNMYSYFIYLLSHKEINKHKIIILLHEIFSETFGLWDNDHTIIEH